MTPKEYKQMMDYLTRSGIKDQVKFASDLARPNPKPEIKEIEAINAFIKRNPRADGGMLVQPSADGSRPGYAKDKEIKKSLTAEKIVSDYKKTVAKFSMKGDLSKAPSLNNYLQNKYGKNYRTQESIIKRY